MAYVISPDGTPGTLDDAELPKALDQGFKVRQPTPQELARSAAADQPIIAGIEAAGRAAIPIVGARIVGNIGAEITGQSQADALQSQRLRKEENPVSAAVGTAAGFTAGPAKVLGVATTPLRAASLAGRFGAGVLEGTAMGINEAVNESVLENTPLTAERLVASTVASALTGGAIDFGFGAVGKLGSLAMQKAGGVAVNQSLKSMAVAPIRAELVSKGALRKYGKEGIDEAIEQGFQKGLITKGTTYESLLEGAERQLGQMSPRYDQMLDTVEAVAPTAGANAQLVLDSVQRGLKKFDRSMLDSTAEAWGKDIERRLLDKAITLRDIHGIQRDIFLDLPLDATGKALKGPKAVADVVRDSINEALDPLIEKGVDLAAQQGAGGLTGAVGKGFYKNLSREYKNAITLKNLVEDQAMGAEARGLGFKEIVLAGAAGAATGGPVGVGVAIGGSFLTKQIRERGGFVLGGAMRELADSGAMRGIAKSFQKNVLQRLSSAPELLGPFRQMIEQAASQGAMDLLETHMQLANSERGQEYMTSMGMSPESPAEMASMGVKLSALGAIKSAADAQDAAMNSAIEGLFGSAAGRKPSMGAPMTIKEFTRTQSSIQAMLRDPEAMYARIDPSIHGSAPGAAGTTAAALLNTARFLDSKMPKDPSAGMPPSIATLWEPSAADIDKFNRYREAVESPARVLKNMASGYISPEQVEALKAVYPAMYADLQMKLSERLMMQKKPLSYQQRLAIAAITGPQALGMTPQQAQILQQSQALASGQVSGQGKPPKGPDGRQDVNEAQIQTEAQKLEARA